MIPLKEWLRCVYKNYLDLLEFARSEKLKVAEFDFLVYTYLPKIADYILNIDSGAKNELISKILDIPIEVVQAVMAKPISYLRKNKETSDRVKEVKARIKELKEFNAPKFTEDLIKKL